MADMLDRHQPAEVAAGRLAEGEPGTVRGVARGRHDVRRAPGAGRRCAAPPSAAAAVSLERWIADHKIPVGDSVAVVIEYVKTHGERVLQRHLAP